QRPGVDEIVQRTVVAVERGDGNVILLHDSGGDRSQTVQALPLIIEELLSRSRDEVMPPVPPESLWQIWTDRLAFSVLNLVAVIIHWLFLLGIVLGIARLMFIGLLAVYQRWFMRSPVYD